MESDSTVTGRLLHKMEENMKRRGRVLVSDVNRLINVLERTNSFSASQAHIMIKSCGETMADLDRKRRTELVDRQFSLFQRINKNQLDVSHYNLLLSVSIHTCGNKSIYSNTLSFRFIMRINIQSMLESFSQLWRLTASNPTE